MEKRLRAYKVALDPKAAQRARLEQCAGAARHAYNLLVAENRRRADRYHLLRDHYKARGLGPAQIKAEIAAHDGEYPQEPTRPIGYQQYATQELTTQIRQHRDAAARIAQGGDPQTVWTSDRYAEPWMHTIPRRVHVSGLQHANVAVTNWLSSLSGKRKGRRLGPPRFKKKGRSRDAFTMAAGSEKIGARGLTYGRGRQARTIDDYRHVYLAALGAFRTHDSTKRLVRAIDRGGRVTSVTVLRSGTRWYASLLVEETVDEPVVTRAQRAAGTVGVDVGVKTQAALSTGEVVENIRPGPRAAKRLTRIQRQIARAENGSNRQKKLYRRLAAAQHHVAQQRATAQHALTKRLATRFDTVAVEDLNVAGMTASARGTVEEPGRNVRAKSGLNRGILDVGFGEIRRQLEYKTSWYGSQLHIVDRYLPSSKTCHACGTVKPKLSLRERVFECECGYRADRDVNAARNIAAATPLRRAKAGPLADGRSERQNGRGGTVPAPSPGTIRDDASEASRLTLEGEPPVGSDPDLPLQHARGG